MDDEEKQLCFRCVGEPFLKQTIKEDGEKAICSYCGKSGKALTLPAVADIFERVFEEHYYRTPDEPSPLEYTLIKESDYDWERHGEPVLYLMQDIATVEENVAKDIRRVLNERHSDLDSDQMGQECEFDVDSHYADRRVNADEWRFMWHDFERSLKEKSRFFSKTAALTLAEVFSDLEHYRTGSGKKIVVNVGPQRKVRSLYRARVFQSDAKLKTALAQPDKEIGSPPALVAAAGRMNARGISVFYGATDPKVAIAEVRPSVGSRVVTGCFEIIRELRLLDLQAFRTLDISGSLFDPGFIKRLEKAKFLKELTTSITAPVMPDDEAFSYLPTQAIADFLATEIQPAIDGIMYPSVQGAKGKNNVVLFHKAALVEPYEVPEGTEIDVQLSSSTSDGDDVDYWVWENTPKKKSADGHKKAAVIWSPLHEELTYNEREATLRLVTASMKVHHITGIEFKMDDYPIKRHRSEKHDYPF